MDAVLERAAAEAMASGVEAIGVEDVFLAILDDEEAIPTQVLQRLGLEERIQGEVRSVLLSDTYRGYH